MKYRSAQTLLDLATRDHRITCQPAMAGCILTSGCRGRDRPCWCPSGVGEGAFQALVTRAGMREGEVEQVVSMLILATLDAARDASASRLLWGCLVRGTGSISSSVVLAEVTGSLAPGSSVP